jgi:hypothetical protein
VFDAISIQFDAVSNQSDAVSIQFDAASIQFDAVSNQSDAASIQFDATSIQFDAVSNQSDAVSIQFGAASVQFDATSVQFGAASVQFDAISVWEPVLCETEPPASCRCGAAAVFGAVASRRLARRASRRRGYRICLASCREGGGGFRSAGVSPALRLWEAVLRTCSAPAAPASAAGSHAFLRTSTGCCRRPSCSSRSEGPPGG